MSTVRTIFIVIAALWLTVSATEHFLLALACAVVADLLLQVLHQHPPRKPHKKRQKSPRSRKTRP